MKYAIYGANRVTKDLLYVFDDMDVVCVFADKDEDAIGFHQGTGIKVYPIQEIENYAADFDELLLCDFDLKNKYAVLEEVDFSGTQIVELDDIVKKVDEHIINPEERHLLIWGAGRKGEAFLNAETENIIDGYIDKYSKERDFHGYSLCRPTDIKDWKRNYVVIAVVDNADIIKYLEECGLRHYEDFCTYDEFIGQLSRMLKKTLLQQSVFDFSCETMLNHAEIAGHGNVVCCCSTFIYHSLGNVSYNKSFSSCWNSLLHRIMCLSNVNRTYTFCKQEMCPLFIGRRKTKDFKLAVPYKKMENGPKTVALGFDKGCNLYCITCRNQIEMEKEDQLPLVERYADSVCKEVLPFTEFLIMAGNGEVLLTKSYQSVYSSENMKGIKYFRLLTNGMLFTPKKWSEIRAKTNAKIMMTVSIDAATAETYEKIRRGGNFSVLQNNMEYAAKLRAEGDLSYLRFNFVVQRMNYKEMPLFVEWGKRLGIDEVFFTKILNWGTYTIDEFKAISMMEEDGITPKKELIDVLDNPIFSERIVDLGTIRYQHEDVSDKYVENYYRWELERKVPGLFEK